MKTNLELARECGVESMTNPFAIKQIIDERNAALDMVRTVETLNAELEEKIEALQLVVNGLTRHTSPQPTTKPMTEGEINTLIGNWFAEDWAIKNARGMLRDLGIGEACT